MNWYDFWIFGFLFTFALQLHLGTKTKREIGLWQLPLFLVIWPFFILFFIGLALKLYWSLYCMKKKCNRIMEVYNWGLQQLDYDDPDIYEKIQDLYSWVSRETNKCSSTEEKKYDQERK